MSSSVFLLLRMKKARVHEKYLKNMALTSIEGNVLSPGFPEIHSEVLSNPHNY